MNQREPGNNASVILYLQVIGIAAGKSVKIWDVEKQVENYGRSVCSSHWSHDNHMTVTYTPQYLEAMRM